MTPIVTPRDFLKLVVEEDLKDFRADQSNVRKAWHSASSLFHQADWVFNAHRASVITAYGLPAGTKRETEFADALAAQNDYFQLIRGAANASKHHTLRKELPNSKLQSFQPTEIVFGGRLGHKSTRW